MNFSPFTHITFDCYGTLIDWETGILAAVMPVLERYSLYPAETDVLRLYVKHEAEQERGEYKEYREVLRGVMAGIAEDLGFSPTAEDFDALPDSLGSWPPFPDTVDALKRLQQRYKLDIVSNIDDDLFAQTQALLGIQFDEIITAQQVGAYKPLMDMFESALKRLNVPKEQVLHVAQSLYHDHVPAKQMGFSTVWVNRPSRLATTGLSLPANIVPNLEVPDLASLAMIIEQLE
jgi:2-haloacid dehalogenase